MDDERPEIDPLQPIRRFDVFAETKRREALARGAADDVAKGYGIRIAKVVASRRFGGAAKTPHMSKDESRETTGPLGLAPGEKFRALDGELQTDASFDHEIIDRMGQHFYESVFSPAIVDALDAGRKYEQFRDTIRKDWKPIRGGKSPRAMD